MGFDAFLEIRGKDSLSIRNENNVNVGNPLATFLAAYEDFFLRNTEAASYEWFLHLESRMTVDLRILLRFMYFGEGDYTSDEINFSLSRIKITIMQASEYLELLKNIERKWCPIDDVINAVIELIRLLTTEVEITYWFEPANTMPAFNSLLKIMQMVKKNDGEEVRIQFL